METLLQDTLPFEVLLSDEAEYDRHARSLFDRLQKDPPPDITNTSCLDAIDPSDQTIIYACVLSAHINAASSGGKAASRQLSEALLPEGSLWPYITRFLLDFNPIQVRYAGLAFSKVVAVVAQGAEQTSNLVPAIQLLQNAILRLDPSSSTLTTNHFTLIRLCLFARAFSDATLVLDLPIYSIANDFHDKSTSARAYKYLCSNHESSSAFLTPSSGLTGRWTSRSYLEYYLMAGMCYLGQKQYVKASFAFEVVLTTPAAQNTASLVMVEAYKKWLLVNLLMKGTTPMTPRSINQATIKTIRAVAKPYECLAEAFKSGNMTRLDGEISEGQEVWDQDCNTGLVLEVAHSFRKYAIIHLGKTYAALSIAEIARRTSPDPSDPNETAAYLKDLIDSGHLSAVLVSPTEANATPMLRFLPSISNTTSEAQVQQELAMRSLELQAVLIHVAASDHKLEISKDYIDHLKKLKKQKDEKQGKDGAAQDSAFEVIDEDMMDF